MKEKNLVLTIAMGEDYQKMKVLTHRSIKVYADKIGADFISIEERKISKTSPHWEKFQIYNLLNIYDRIMYIDTDIIIREDAPNLFKKVSKYKLGMFEEAQFTDRSKELMIGICKAYNTTLKEWNGHYYNSGVIVLSKRHKQLFKKPDIEVFSFYEQSYLNMMIAKMEIEMQGLEYKFNRMTCLDKFTGEERFNSYFIHYAGYPSIDWVLQQIPRDLAKWEKDKPDYKYTQHVYIAVTGGLGDQINAEPAVRFAKEYVFSDAEITVATHFPRLFEHLDVKVCEHGKFEPGYDTPYYLIESLPGPTTPMWAIVSNLLCHTTDYCAMAIMRRILPTKDKRIQLPVKLSDYTEITEIIGIRPIKDLVVVHPGRHWESKTIPKKWWQEVVDSLHESGLQVCLVGQNEKTRGVHDLDVKEGMINLVDIISLDALIGLISEAQLLITNDSAPLHIAGAFDNRIITIPTCKHPDHILPWRHNSQYWRAKALYKKLTIDDVSSKPTEVHGVSGQYVKGDWSEYLPEVKEVVDAALEMVKEVEDEKSTVCS